MKISQLIIDYENWVERMKAKHQLALANISDKIRRYLNRVDKMIRKDVKSLTDVPTLPPGCRCRKLKGRYIPQSCHVLNGRKPSCEDLIIPEGDEEVEIPQFII